MKKILTLIFLLFSLISYSHTVTFSAGDNGNISATVDGNPIVSGVDILDNKTVVFTASPNSGFFVHEWIVNTVVNSDSSKIYSVITTNSNIDVKVNFADSPLPIVLTLFDVKCDNNILTFNWQTASETNNNFFIVEYSNDLINWEQIGDMIVGNGNTNSPTNYNMSVICNHNTKYFRLKQVDFDGSYSYSDIISIKCIDRDIKIYNKFDKVIIEVNCIKDEKTEISLINIEYRNVYKINKISYVGYNKYEIDETIQGIYVVSISSNNENILNKTILISN